MAEDHPAVEWLRREKELAWNDGYHSAHNGREVKENPYLRRSPSVASDNEGGRESREFRGRS